MMEFGLFSEKGFPHSGWECVEIEENPEKQICECCKKTEIRFVHRLTHPLYRDIEVGCVCAANLEGKPKEAKERKKRFKRKMAFIYKGWKIANEGEMMCYKRRGSKIYLQEGKYGVWYNEKICWHFHGKSMKTFEEAAEAAFEARERVRAGR